MTQLERILALVGIAETLGPGRSVFNEEQTETIVQVIDSELGGLDRDGQVATLTDLALDIYRGLVANKEESE